MGGPEGQGTRRVGGADELATAVSRAQLALALVDLDDLTIRAVSPAALKHLGLPASAVVDRPAADLVGGEDRGNASDALHALRRGVIDAYVSHRTLHAPIGRDPMTTQWLRAFQLEANLRRAFAHDELALALQPIVALADATPTRAEALLRWSHEGNAVSPCDFVPVAEETGLIIPIGDWTIDRAAQLAANAPGGRVLVNLSPRQIAAPGLLDRVARILSRRNVDPSAVGFEVTETLLMEHFDHTADILGKLRGLGCVVGLDDFGTGYSSFSYLRRLPIDFIKIDGELTTDIDSDEQARAIVGAIITMTDALALDVIAEGVETAGQARTLTELGCEQAQGYYFGRPVLPD